LAKQVCGNWSARRTHKAEIEDYLYCVIEDHVKNGMTEEEAFRKAREQAGAIDSLRVELEKSSRLRLTSPSVQKWCRTLCPALVVGGPLLRESLLAGWTLSHVFAVDRTS
jgi:hypothetical protein